MTDWPSPDLPVAEWENQMTAKCREEAKNCTFNMMLSYFFWPIMLCLGFSPLAILTLGNPSIPPIARILCALIFVPFLIVLLFQTLITHPKKERANRRYWLSEAQRYSSGEWQKASF